MLTEANGIDDICVGRMDKSKDHQSIPDGEMYISTRGPEPLLHLWKK